MKLRAGNELIPLNLLVMVLVTVILLSPSNILRIILGIPFLLFFPGYALMAALFPKREGMDGIERVGLGFGLSIVVVSLISLILNYTPWGIRLETILYSVVSFIFISSVIAWGRRRRLPEEGGVRIEFHLTMPGCGRGSIRNMLLSIILVIAILGAIGTLGYIIATPRVGVRFTEFYFQGVEDKVIDNPMELPVGAEGRVIVGIVNHEKVKVSYLVAVTIDGVKNNKVGPIVLGEEQKWEEIIGFTPDKVSDNQKVEFLLYKNGEDKPYRESDLWINVKE